ncbi:MAG: 4a-hydroxytetrahydrobiopterin dehydratase [Tepidiformaceae bacterium]
MPEPLSPTDVAARTGSLGGWNANGNQKLTRRYTFGSHIEAIGFVVRVAMVAEVLDHHPDLRLVYNRVELVLSTHDAGGVTAKDFELAERINELAAQA